MKTLPQPADKPRMAMVASRNPIDAEHRMLRAAAAILGVVLFGTVGFMVVEGWSLWQSLFFTLITITTVGYGDYGISETGERFTAILLIFGIGVATYAIGQFVRAAVDHHYAWERKMNHRIAQLKDHYIVCGLGRIGVEVCTRLALDGVPFVGIDADREAVEHLVDLGHLARVGDGTDDGLLEDIGIRHARGIACLTSSDTENIVITMTAREMNPAMTIISRAESHIAIRKIQRAGATRVISPIRTGGVSIAETILNPNLADLLNGSHDGESGIRLAETTIEPGSPLDGMSVRDYGESHPSLVFVAIKTPDGPVQLRPIADRRLTAGAVLIVAGDPAGMAALSADTRGAAAAA